MSDDPLQMVAKRSRTPPATVMVSTPPNDERELVLVERDAPRPAPVILTDVKDRLPVGRPRARSASDGSTTTAGPATPCPTG